MKTRSCALTGTERRYRTAVHRGPADVQQLTWVADGWGDARGGSSRGAGFGRHRLVPQHGQCQQTPDRQGVAACGGRPLGPLYLMLDAWYMRGLLTHAVLR